MSLVMPLDEQTAPPAAVQLSERFDPVRLRAELALLTKSRWSLQQTIADDGSLTESVVDWRCLALRSLGGDQTRSDCGGPELAEFMDTGLLDEAPYLAEVLASIPAELRSARLMALGPGASSAEHHDTKYGPPWGTARLHVPIATTPGATLFLDGQQHRWEPGSLWFGDFSRAHRVQNTDSVVRVHLVTDVLVSGELLALFPPRDREAWLPHVLFNQPRVPLRPEQLTRFAVRFALPASFAGWEEPDGEFLRPQRTLDASTDVVGDRLVLFLDGRPSITLVHIGRGEFRFAGWTDERTISFSRHAKGTLVILCSRVGHAVRSADILVETP